MRTVLWNRRTRAILTLALLSPIFGELISGSSPPLEFFNPVSLLLLWMFYGAGTLLAREAWVRWGKGGYRLMFLGMAYGAFEEGLMIKSWFDPNWMDLGPLATYGRCCGTNLVWAVWLTIFHSIMSIAAPIIIFETFFLDYRKRPLLGRRGISLAFASLFISGALFYFGLNPYVPPAGPYLLAVLFTAGMLLLARKSVRGSVFPWKTKRPVIHGFSAAVLLFLVFVILPNSLPPVVTVMAGIMVVLAFFSQMEMFRKNEQYGLIFGFVSFWALPMAVILELNGALGVSVVGITVFLILLMRYRTLENTGPTQTNSEDNR